MSNRADDPSSCSPRDLCGSASERPYLLKQIIPFAITFLFAYLLGKPSVARLDRLPEMLPSTLSWPVLSETVLVTFAATILASMLFLLENNQARLRPLHLRLLAAASILAALGYEFCRFRSRIISPQFYAEDGAIFYKQAHDAGIYCLKFSYAGYLLLYPRLCSVVAQYFPLRWGPALFIGMFALTQLLVWCLIWSKRNHATLLPKILMTFALVIVPSNGEVFFTLTNALWIMATGLIMIMVMDPPRTRRSAIFETIILVLIGFTGPFFLLLFPIFFCRWLILLWRKQTLPGETWRMITCCGIFLIYGLAMALFAHPTHHGFDGLTHTVIALQHTILPFFYGSLHPKIYDPHNLWTNAACLVLLLGILLPAFLSRKGLRPRLNIALLLCSAGILIFAMILRESNNAYNPRPYYYSDRFFYVPFVCMFWMLALSTVTASNRFRACLRQSVALALLLIAMVFNANCFDMIKHWPQFDFAAAAEMYEQTGKTVIKNPTNWAFPLDKSQRNHPEIPPERNIYKFLLPVEE